MDTWLERRPGLAEAGGSCSLGRVEGGGGHFGVRLFPIPVCSPKIPPVKVVAGRWSASTKDSPTPLVHQVAKGQEGNFFQCHL